MKTASSTLQKLIDLTKEAGKVAQTARQHLNVAQKSDGSLVTEADRRVESFLRRELPALVPGTTVWGEEEGFSSVGENGLWAVDPVDGTSNFSFGSHFWGVTVALIQNHEPVLGVIVLPDLHDVYAAELGAGATHNGQPLGTLRGGPIQRHELVSYSDDSLLAYGDQLPGKMRYMGAWVVEAALVFDGVFRGALSHKASLYDVAGSVVICREMGGDVRYLDGSPFLLEPLYGTRGLGKPMLLFSPDTGLVIE